MIDRPYLIWSNEHKSWWRPNSRGYTRRIEDAGRYSVDEAEAICRNGGTARAGSRGGPPYEVAVLSRHAIRPQGRRVAMSDEDAEISALKAEVARLTPPDGSVTVPLAFPNLRTGAALVAVPSDMFNSSPTEAQKREDALIARAETAEASVKELEAGLRLVRGLIVEGAATGFNPLDGDWAERLYASQGITRPLLSPKDKTNG